MARTFWTDEQEAILRARYANERTEDIAQAIGRDVKSLYQKALSLGLKKSAEFLASPAAGRTNGRQGMGTRFGTGLTPWNKGMKGLDIGGKATRFKSGQTPHNTKPIGSYRITRDGTLQRKINNDKGSNSKRWRGVHELVWVETNGPVPHGHIVVFRPGQRTDKVEEITIDRVECITFSENMKRNTVHNYPPEIAKAVQLIGALNRKINRGKQHQ